MDAALGGIVLTLVAGVIGGSVLAPMKFVRGWKWENTWLLYSFSAYFLFPWLVAAATVPNLPQVYAAAGAKAVFWTGLFGFGWGLAVVLYGIAVDIVGLSLTSGIILGSSVAVGSLLPLTFLGEPVGNWEWIAAADAVMLAGVLLCARAGGAREKARPRDPRFKTGIVICFAAGLLSTLFNIALAYGGGISRQAVSLGADPFYAANAVWSLAVSLGSLPSLAWTLYLLKRNGTWPAFREGSAGLNAGLCVFMGALWISGTVLYGASAGLLGPLGTVVGWPIYMSAMILGNNLWGWVTGEWRGAGARPVRLMLAGIAVQILAMVLLGRLK